MLFLRDAHTYFEQDVDTERPKLQEESGFNFWDVTNTSEPEMSLAADGWKTGGAPTRQLAVGRS